MRATLDTDPNKGPGHAILTLHDIGEQNLANPVLKRIGDGLELGTGGWQKPPCELPFDDRQWTGSGLNLFLAPDVVNNLAADEKYEVEIPGFGRCPLWFSGLLQSHILNNNGSVRYASGTVTDFGAQTETANTLDQEISPSPAYSRKNGAGISPAVENHESANARRNKRGGCLFLAIFGIAIWLSGAWLLWHGSMAGKNDQPAPVQEIEEEKDAGPFFEIIPGSAESSFVETEEETTAPKQKQTQPEE